MFLVNARALQSFDGRSCLTAQDERGLMWLLG